MYSMYVLFSAILYYFLCYYCKACLSVRNSRYINKLLLLLLETTKTRSIHKDELWILARLLALVRFRVNMAQSTSRFRLPKTASEEEICCLRAVLKSTKYKNKWSVKILEEWQRYAIKTMILLCCY